MVVGCFNTNQLRVRPAIIRFLNIYIYRAVVSFSLHHVIAETKQDRPRINKIPIKYKSRCVLINQRPCPPLPLPRSNSQIKSEH